MTSRERVYKALRFEEPDRVPVDIGGTLVTGIHMDQYAMLCEKTGLDLTPPKVFEQLLMVAKTDPQMLTWLGSDVLNLENTVQNWGYHNEDWKMWRSNRGNNMLVPRDFNYVKDERGYTYLINADGERCAQMSPNSDYFDFTLDSTLHDDIEYIDIKKFRESLPDLKDEHLERLQKRAKFYHENTTFSLHGGFLNKNLFTTGGVAGYNFTDLVVLIQTEPEYIKEIVMTQAEWQLNNLRRYMQAVGPYVDSVLISTSDFGGQKCELIRPESFRDIYMPAYKMLCDHIHECSDAKTLSHCCGSIRHIIPYMIEAGIDCLNPVQTSAGGMDAAELKAEFGGKIVFWGGGIDTQHTLPHGTPEDVREMVKERIKIFAPGGGFIFTQIHNLQADVPFENVVAMLDAVKEFGSYPIVK